MIRRSLKPLLAMLAIVFLFASCWPSAYDAGVFIEGAQYEVNAVSYRVFEIPSNPDIERWEIFLTTGTLVYGPGGTGTGTGHLINITTFKPLDTFTGTYRAYLVPPAEFMLQSVRVDMDHDPAEEFWSADHFWSKSDEADECGTLRTSLSGETIRMLFDFALDTEDVSGGYVGLAEEFLAD